MPYNPNKHRRRSIRMHEYDYSKEGLYFITICVKDKECLFGRIQNGELELNEAGKIMDEQWLMISNRFPNTVLHEYIVMPNHFHAIIEITEKTISDNESLTDAPVGVTLAVTQAKHKGQPQGLPLQNAKRLGDIVGAYKSITTDEYINNVKCNNWPPFNKKLFQRNYYEHIIRNKESYEKIRNYILNHPASWEDDIFYSKFEK